MRTLLALAAVAIAAASAVPAVAGPCAGSTGTRIVCVHPENVEVDPYGGPAVGDCVYLASATCTPVFVPTPTVTSGPPVTVS